MSVESYLALGFGVECCFFSLEVLVCELMFLRVFLDSNQVGRTFPLALDGRESCPRRKSRGGLWGGPEDK